jgi:predicted amidohydrolase YtcJ
MYLKKLFYTCVILSCLSSCGNETNKSLTKPATAGTLYYGGKILTMEGDAPNYVEAVIVKDGKILFAGTKAEADKLKEPEMATYNLEGSTMLPGFVDGHSHFSEIGLQASVADLLPSPDGDVSNLAELRKKLKDYADTSQLARKHQIIIGMNYDDGQLAEKRHPTRHDLDSISKDTPVMIIHQSGHLCVLNSIALKNLNIGIGATNPPGGVIQMEADKKTPNGVLEELAFFNILPILYPKFDEPETNDLFKLSTEKYIANGFTTIQDGRTSPTNLKSLLRFDSAGFLKVDVVSYPDLILFDSLPLGLDLTKLVSRTYASKHRFRAGGVKLTLDGSPQGRTAWFSKPYLPLKENKNTYKYNGYPAFKEDSILKRHLKTVFANKWQLLVHCNGDSAVAQLLPFLKPYTKNIDHRTTIIHGQFITKAQVEESSTQNVLISAFPLHSFNWGDFHIESLGLERAKNLSPTGWLVDKKMKFSIHSDAPVIFPASMPLLSTAILRKTRKGIVLGDSHRLKPYVALQAMTIWPAYQHFEENTKGSIAVGKLADFVILDRNPIEEPLDSIKVIRVLRTIKEGVAIYDKPNKKSK